MNRTSSIAITGLGLMIGIAGAGCSTTGPDGEPTTNGLPALTAEEQAVVENMARNTLAEIELPEGRMQFVEAAPGEVLVVREFPVGAKLTRVEGENGMTLEELFHAYDPSREIPRALLDAAARVAGTASVTEARSTTIAARAGTSAQSSTARTIEPAVDGVERVHSALASTIDVNWFTLNFCNVSGADYTFCFAAAWGGAMPRSAPIGRDPSPAATLDQGAPISHAMGASWPYATLATGRASSSAATTGRTAPLASTSSATCDTTSWAPPALCGSRAGLRTKINSSAAHTDFSDGLQSPPPALRRGGGVRGGRTSQAKRDSLIVFGVRRRSDASALLPSRKGWFWANVRRVRGRERQVRARSGGR